MEDGELAIASHEGRVVRTIRGRADVQQPVRVHGLRLALEDQRLHRLDLDRVPNEPERWLADQYLAERRCLLQPCRDVDRVAGREALLGPGHHFAGHDADPSLHTERRQRVPHLHCRADGAKRVVLVQHRHAEDCHHGVPDELLHAAAVALHRRPHLLEVPGEQSP